MKNPRTVSLIGKCLFLLFPLFFFQSCKEDIDESNFAIKSEQTAADFISSHDEFSMMREVLSKVTLGDSDGASSLFSVLTARGNYTLFLPTDDAVKQYLSSLGLTDISELTEEQLKLIAKSCIIDNQNH